MDLVASVQAKIERLLGQLRCFLELYFDIDLVVRLLKEFVDLRACILRGLRCSRRWGRRTIPALLLSKAGEERCAENGTEHGATQVPHARHQNTCTPES